MIRPLDLQNSILQSIASAPAVQRADEGPRLAAQAAQAAFAAEVTVRDESVAPAAEAAGNRIGAKPEQQRERPANKRRIAQHVSFDEVVERAADSAFEQPHLIDVTA